MSKLTLAGVFVLAYAALWGAGSADAIRARRQANFEKRYGGWVYQRDPASKAFVFVNCQKRLPASAFAEPLRRMTTFLQCDFALAEGSWDGTHGESGHIYLIDDATRPMSGIFPEDGWGFMNVAKLGEKNLSRRLFQEMWRTLGYVGGAISSGHERCVLNPVFSADDLDKCLPDTLSPEAAMRMPDYLRAMGIKPFTRMTFRDACKRGVAPQPTNDYQRAIFQEERAKSVGAAQK